MNTAERRVRLRRQLRDRQHVAFAAAVADLRAAAAPYLADGRPDLAGPYLESAALFEAAQSEA